MCYVRVNKLKVVIKSYQLTCSAGVVQDDNQTQGEHGENLQDIDMCSCCNLLILPCLRL